MLRISLRFLTGRYHATPWGRHVNEGVPEWPPSPWRLLRALVDTCHRKLPRWQADRLEPLLEALASQPPRISLPPARGSHTRSYLHQNKTDPSDKKLIFDAFVATDSDLAVVMGWDDVSLDDEQIHQLSELLSKLNYLGRSESWVEAWVLDERAPALLWNCTLAEQGPGVEGAEIVPVTCMESAGSYAMHPWITGKGKKKKQVSWLEALSWSTTDFLSQGMSQPPGQVQRMYWRPSDALDAPPPTSSPERHRKLSSVLYALSGPTLPPVTEALELGEQARVRLMGAHKKVVGYENISKRFSGKDAEGRPLRGHQHLHFLARDLDGDGRIDHLLVWGEESLKDDEITALQGLKSLYLRGRPDLICAVNSWGDSRSLRAPSVEVTSRTPFVPPRHYKARRDGPEGEWLERELLRELGHRGLPMPVEITALDHLKTRQRRVSWREFRRNRKEDSRRRGFGFRLCFDEPVAAPFTLGYGSHFGLGLFEAVKAP